MKNWAIQSLRYDYNPSPQNYLKYRHSHFHFCKKDDPTITASLYLDNLLNEVKIETGKQTAVNKKLLTISVIKRSLENEFSRLEMETLFSKQTISNEDIRQFLETIASFTPTDKKKVHDSRAVEEANDHLFPARTYVIATHIYLEINNNEPHYETLIRDVTALKEFIAAKFKASKLPGRIADMKNFSYKKIVQSKSNEGAKGQLKPQLKQIANNPEIFGKEVSTFAERIIETHF